MNTQQLIKNGEAILGIELGSTRIKAVLIEANGHILATGFFDWENHFEQGIWTYHQNEIWLGLQTAYANLAQQVVEKYHVVLARVKAIGISAMMHGYLPFDKQNNLLVPFRTWRNNITAKSSQKLTALFQHNIPQRWTISHLYHAILQQEAHLNQIDYLTTLSGYIHWQLTGEKVLGIGDASGVFPVDLASRTYDQTMLAQFDQLIAEQNYPWHIADILPQVRVAGEEAGKLTDNGAKLLDPTGNLQSGIPFCPPEGDAGTGMVATNSVKVGTGNISAGTSAFAMIVLEKALTQVYPELDIVTTPCGKLVAMAHANNCSSAINAWVHLFSECLTAFGIHKKVEEIYPILFNLALQGDANAGGLIAYGFYSGEHCFGLSEGCPLFLHPTTAQFNLANFMLVQLYAAFAAMQSSMNILLQQEKVNIQQILGHGGIFKTKGVAQQILASALNIPIATMDTANEGGAWGIALLANFMANAKTGMSLEDYLAQDIFIATQKWITLPDVAMQQGYTKFMQRYQKGIPLVETAVNLIQ